LTTSLRRSGSLLGRLAQPLIDPAVFDFWAGRINPTWTWARALARVVERRAEAQGVVTLVLQPNRHWQGFQPGQHLNVGAELDGRRITRSYSLSGMPQPDRRIAITVKQVDGGKLSTHLCQHTQVGDVLALGPAFGDMTLPAQPQGRWVFLAAGSGITPFLSLTRTLAAQGMPVDLTLVVWARTRAELCALAELQALAQREPRFQLKTVLTRETQLQAGEHSGRISAETLTTLLGPLPELAHSQVLACGPGGFVTTARQLLQPQAQRFQAEAFSPLAVAELAAEAPKTVEIQLRRSGRTITVDSSQALLPALEAQGLHPAAGCRMGICRTCVCTKLEGTVQDLHTGERDTEGGSALRLCVSRACTDLALDL
jgi:stearoyl-CoA 9-desaturase NADPH oxidoreductase